MRDRIQCLKCGNFFYRNNKGVVCPTCIQKDSKEYYTQKICNLEVKLAESEEEIKEWIAVRDDKNNIINKQTEKINQLKQQLAEKEKESHNVYPFIKKYDNGIFVEYNVVCEREGIVSTTCFGKNKEMAEDYLKSLGKPKTISFNQDKIELLERLKEDFETILDKAIKNCSMNERYYDQIFDKLDELITELKEKL